MGDVDDRLEVKIVAAEGLRDMEGGDCNPYCEIRCGTDRERTAAKASTTNPVFNTATMLFGGLTENGTDHLIVDVLHNSRYSSAADQPLGQAIIELRTVFLSPGIIVDDWYDLRQRPGQQEPVQGRIRLEIAYFMHDDDLLSGDESSDDDEAARLPNMLVGTIHRGRAFFLPGKATVDSFVTVKVGSTKMSTKVVRRTNAPRWDHAFQIPVADGNALIQVKVKDSGVLRKRVIGAATIPLVEVAACGEERGLVKWQRLAGDGGTVDGVERGEVEIQLQWKYDHRYARSMLRLFNAAAGLMRRKAQAPENDEAEALLAQQDADHAWMTQQEEVVALALTTKEQEEVQEQRAARAMMAERRLDELTNPGDHAMVRGDYQVQVHVIECRDLASEDLNGLSDPYARVKVLGRTKKTRVVRRNLSPTFDEVLYFNLKDVAKAEIEEAVVEVAFYDYDAFQTHALIGIANFDVRAVHALDDHEFYRKFVGLVDTKSASDSGYQGYVKLSITVLGPGDDQKPHDLEKEYQQELDDEMAKGGGLGGVRLTSLGPEKTQLVYLVVYVWEAQDLPSMNTGLFSSGGVEAYARVDFAGSRAQTAAVTCRGRHLNPVFGEEIWIPVFEPSEANRVKLGLWDYNTTSRDRPVAHAYFDYAEVKRVPKLGSGGGYAASLLGGSAKYVGPRPRWHNLYGAPLGVQGKRGALQNKYGDEATTYRGRILVSMVVVTKPPEARSSSQVARVAPFAFRPTAGLKPATVKYHLRALCVRGSEIPAFSTRGGLGTVPMGIQITVGNYALDFDLKPNKRGLVEWNQLRSLKHIELPVLLDEVPDVCVYLIRGPPKQMRVCYLRIPAAQLLKDQFLGDPAWYHLKADKIRTRKMGGVALTANPGAVLLKLGFGLSDDAVDPQFAWSEEALLKKASTLKPYCLRVLIYQARNLPASDENGLLDPYVKVRFCGTKEKTSVKSMTTAPLFYETVSFHEMLPEDVAFGPDVLIQVWDQDRLSPNTPMALLRFPLKDCFVLPTETSMVPPPKWHRLSDVNGESLGAEILVQCALLRKRDIKEKLSRPEAIFPVVRPAWIEITSVGVRQLKAVNMRQPRMPYVRFDVQSGEDGGGTIRTRPSKKPSARNANFLERQIIPVELPDKVIFAPRLDMRVYDHKVGISTAGQQILIGACSIDLASKMTWNADGYIAPQMELFDDTEARAREHKLERDRLDREVKDDDEDEDITGGDDGEPQDEGNLGFLASTNDDDGDGDDDADSADDGEAVEQYELERAPETAKGKLQDAGTGAFDANALTDLPMVYEDLVYEQEQKRLAHELEEEAAAGLARGRSWVDIVEARLAAATDLNELTGDNSDYKLSELGIAFPTQWAESEYTNGRDWWVQDHDGKELEAFLKTKPFETYPIYRGRYHPDPKKSTLRVIGYFKGVIRVLESDPATEVDEFLPMKLLRPPATYTVRLYVIKGANLQPVDGSSTDPYLRVKLGTDVQDRPQNHLDKTLKPDFYETFEFSTTLPGPATLKIQVKDWNRFYPIHELVGETRVDLEDRWFHREWQKLDAVAEDLVAPGTALLSKNKLKPIEIRSLHKESTPVAQGQIHMWLEIRPAAETRREPPVELEGPLKKMFEVRLICWASKDVPYEMGDYFAEFWIGDSKHQKTDVHWRCRNGKASWNWRLKFKVELPLAVPEQGRLHIQLWDQDVFKWNDVLGDTQVDLYRWMLKAYHEKRSINVFKIVNDAVRRKRAEEQGLALDEDADAESESDSSDDSDGADSETDSLLGGDREEELKEAPAGDVENPLRSQKTRGGGDDDSKRPLLDDHDIENPPKTNNKKKNNNTNNNNAGDDAAADGKAVDAAALKKEADLDEAAEKKRKDEIAQKDAAFFVESFKDMLGMGEIDETAQWLQMTYRDPKRNKLKRRGKLAVSIEIIPEEDAELRPAGHGRSEPNTNPVLPPTTGRISFSYNPFAICSTLLGPKLAFQLACCFCCCIFLVAFGVIGMYFTSFYNVMQSLGLR